MYLGSSRVTTPLPVARFAGFIRRVRSRHQPPVETGLKPRLKPGAKISSSLRDDIVGTSFRLSSQRLADGLVRQSNVQTAVIVAPRLAWGWVAPFAPSRNRG